MDFLIFNIFILISLIFIIIVGSFQQFAISIIAKKKVEFVVMIIPALLSIISFYFTCFLVDVILKLIHINSFSIIISMFMKWEFEPVNFAYIVIALILSTFLFIFLQACCFKLVNIDYTKNWKKFCSILHKKKDEQLTLAGNTLNQDTASVDLVKYSKYEKISFLNAFIASLFSFSLIFFISILLICIGKNIGETLL